MEPSVSPVPSRSPSRGKSPLVRPPGPPRPPPPPAAWRRRDSAPREWKARANPPHRHRHPLRPSNRIPMVVSHIPLPLAPMNEGYSSTGNTFLKRRKRPLGPVTLASVGPGQPPGPASSPCRRLPPPNPLPPPSAGFPAGDMAAPPARERRSTEDRASSSAAPTTPGRGLPLPGRITPVCFFSALGSKRRSWD